MRQLTKSKTTFFAMLMLSAISSNASLVEKMPSSGFDTTDKDLSIDIIDRETSNRNAINNLEDLSFNALLTFATTTKDLAILEQKDREKNENMPTKDMFFKAIIFGNKEIVESVLNNNKYLALSSYDYDSKTRTFLHIAIDAGNFFAVKKLLEKDAKIDAIYSSGTGYFKSNQDVADICQKQSTDLLRPRMVNELLKYAKDGSAIKAKLLIIKEKFESAKETELIKIQSLELAKETERIKKTTRRKEAFVKKIHKWLSNQSKTS